MPGTLGQSDIFKALINPDGSFGTPQNLGKEIILLEEKLSICN
jgi:hypothetical protein